MLYNSRRKRMDRVLFDSRILSLVMRHLLDTPSALSRAALVNKLWFKISRDVLWYDIPAGAIRPMLFTLPEYKENQVRRGADLLRL